MFACPCVCMCAFSMESVGFGSHFVARLLCWWIISWLLISCELKVSFFLIKSCTLHSNEWTKKNQTIFFVKSKLTHKLTHNSSKIQWIVKINDLTPQPEKTYSHIHANNSIQFIKQKFWWKKLYDPIYF